MPPARVAQAVELARSPALTEEAYAQLLALAYALVRESRYAEAADLFNALVEKRPRDAAALYGAALAAFNTGRAADAELLAQRAADFALGATHARASTDAQERKMRAADALVLLAVIQAVRGDNDTALKTVERAVALAPENFDAQFALGRARYGANDYAGAARAFRAAVALRPADAQARFFLATALEHAGDDAGALAAYRELTVQQPQAAEGHLGLGVLLVKQDGAAVAEGLQELARTLALNPNLYEAQSTLGRVLLARGRVAEAIEHLRRAAELVPDNPEPHYQLSLAYRRLGRKEDAAAEAVIVQRIHQTRRATGADNKPPGTPQQ
jgi:Flp pilus assembly protein TadD